MKEVEIRIGRGDQAPRFAAVLVKSGSTATRSFERARSGAGVQLHLTGERNYHLALAGEPSAADRALLLSAVGQKILLDFPGRRAVRQRLASISGQVLQDRPEPPAAALDLTAGIHGAAPLFLLPGGELAGDTAGPALKDMSVLPVFVAAARWISARRTSSFECLFPPSAFFPDEPLRTERLTPSQAGALLGQVEAVLAAAAPGGPNAAIDDAVQLRSAALTVLSHVVATALKDPEFRAAADAAAERVFRLVDEEAGPGGRSELRAHAISLLSLRGPALRPEQQTRAQALLRSLSRQAPPYAELSGPWRFALASAAEFFSGEVELLQTKYGFTKIAAPEGTPKPPNMWGDGYEVLQAPFVGKGGREIVVFARSASPRDENFEMSQEFFSGLLVSRHANLGAYDMRASAIQTQQVGYKLMMNCQCAGLTTRFAIARMFPDADIFSSWDSTYFRTGEHDKVVASEGIDCFVAILRGLAEEEDFAAIDQRIRKAQWHHRQSRTPDFVQFIGPAHPLVVARYQDINRDGKADYYDGFLDFRLVEIAESLKDSAVPRDPGASPSQISGDAARGLGWAAGSLNRVTQYSELWDSLPGQAEILYAFRAGGFFSGAEPPRDVPAGKGPRGELGRLPAVVRYVRDPAGEALTADVLFHSHLSHSAQELKRLLVGAEAWWRAIDLGYLGDAAPLDTPLGQRAGLLLLLAGLLEFPADQNFVDGLWEMALDMLHLPRLSRSLIRRCNSDEDHNNGNYYGSARGIRELIGTADAPGGALKQANPEAYEELASADPAIGRARPLGEVAQAAGA
ncbi:hypothetical protein [Nannocystis radixulma]|uniref:Uncharacterized protein n=1 Tax=Nannocystis radixulma TaxID=2995305 RepID=A0ABT5BIH0_9BACT|nr:hypothetical protein [Nannocystis radixulma]MDC0673955.1 hypothetical protein [Nannocystis radixulma]